MVIFSYSMKGKTKYFLIIFFCSFMNGNFFGWNQTVGIWPGHPLLPLLENLPKVDRATGNQYPKIIYH